MNLLRLSTLDNLHLYDFNISGESGYLLLEKSLVNTHPKQSQHGIFFRENTVLFKIHNPYFTISKSIQLNHTKA